jgi:pimeloyl-ACP methyl ester carboxylesterase
VVCLHANASKSSQWRSLMDCLAPNFRVLAPDLYGSGQSPDEPSRKVISLHDEAALIEPVLASAGAPLTLVGHSYGAALVLYEPTLFALLDAEHASPHEAESIRGAVTAAARPSTGARQAAPLSTLSITGLCAPRLGGVADARLEPAVWLVRTAHPTDCMPPDRTRHDQRLAPRPHPELQSCNR